jgi:hypothetical protein
MNGLASTSREAEMVAPRIEQNIRRGFAAESFSGNAALI